jgi:Icc protein
VLTVTGDIADDGAAEAYHLADELTRARAARRCFLPGNHDDPDTLSAVLGQVQDLRMVPLSEHWVLASVNSQWVGQEAGRIQEATLARLRDELARVDVHVALCLHHPPISPCTQPECTLVDSDRLLGVVRGSSVRVVLSGHLHQRFEVCDDGISFLGAPSTLNQLCHGGDPHYTDTGEPPAARLVELHDDGGVDHEVVVAASLARQ